MNNSKKEVKVVKTIKGSLSISKPESKTVLICTNGFQTTDSHDATGMFDYYRQTFQKDFPNCEVDPVLLFEAHDPKTHHHRLYEKRLRNAIEGYIAKGYRIILMRYSFSGALVSKMAYKYRNHVDKVILVAPIYDTILNNMIPGYLKYAKKFKDLQKKYGNRISSSMGRQTVKGMFGLLVSIFVSILANRKYMRHITQQTLILRGDVDPMCSEHSAKKVTSHLKGDYGFYLYGGMNHTMLKTVRLNGVVYEDILHFAFDTPFLIQKKEEIKQAKTLQAVRKLDEDGEEIPTFGEIFNSLDPDIDNDAVAREDQF